MCQFCLPVILHRDLPSMEGHTSTSFWTSAAALLPIHRRPALGAYPSIHRRPAILPPPSNSISTQLTCTCASSFTGPSFEWCLPGHLGPACAFCSLTCAQCADGIAGAGVRLTLNVTDAPASCNCQMAFATDVGIARAMQGTCSRATLCYAQLAQMASPSARRSMQRFILSPQEK